METYFVASARSQEVRGFYLVPSRRGTQLNGNSFAAGIPPQNKTSPLSQGNPIEWKLMDENTILFRRDATSPLSQGNPIEWKRGVREKQ